MKLIGRWRLVQDPLDYCYCCSNGIYRRVDLFHLDAPKHPARRVALCARCRRKGCWRDLDGLAGAQVTFRALFRTVRIPTSEQGRQK